MDLLRLLLVFVDVADGVKVSDAWDWVCNNSKELGHYKNSDNAKHDFELTGSREVLGFYDLGNTLKILTEDKDGDGFWMAGGCCFDYGNTAPLAHLYHYNILRFDVSTSCVGWLVLEK